MIGLHEARSLWRRLRRGSVGDPARPFVAVATCVGLLTGTTAPLVAVGLRRVSGETPSWVALGGVLVLWSVLVAAVLDRALPWRDGLRRGLMWEALALRDAAATSGEARRLRCGWMCLGAAGSTVASALAGLASALVAARLDAASTGQAVAAAAGGAVLSVALISVLTARAMVPRPVESSSVGSGVVGARGTECG